MNAASRIENEEIGKRWNWKQRLTDTQTNGESIGLPNFGSVQSLVSFEFQLETECFPNYTGFDLLHHCIGCSRLFQRVGVRGAVEEPVNLTEGPPGCLRKIWGPHREAQTQTQLVGLLTNSEKRDRLQTDRQTAVNCKGTIHQMLKRLSAKKCT